jgi:hypothetical protein
MARGVNCVEWKAGFIFKTPRAYIRMSEAREVKEDSRRETEKKREETDQG